MNQLAPLKTFIIYSSKDRELREQLESHLRALVDLDWISLWSDIEIAPGERWDKAIKDRLLDTEIFLILVSVDFYNSGYIREEEFKTALARLDSGDSMVIPIIVRPCDWESYPVIKDLQVLPPGGHAVTDTDHWKDRDKAWQTIAKKLRERIQGLRVKREVALALASQREKEAAQWENNAETARLRAEKGQLKVDRAPMTRSQWAGIWIVMLGLILFSVWELTRPLSLSHPLTMQTSAVPIVIIEKIGNIDYPMVYVKGGAYNMGSPTTEANRFSDECQHFVTVNSFNIGQTEVTQALWKAVMGSNPIVFKDFNLPANQVSWNDAQRFIKELNAKTGKHFRLPTEIEWEYAAGGGENNRTKYAGTSNDSELPKYANYCDNQCGYLWADKNQTDGYPKISPVGSFKANSLGLYDMSGNVWEWCDEEYGPYPNCLTPEKVIASRVLRGGSWHDSNVDCRTANRYYFNPNSKDDLVGFRLAKTE